MFKFVQRLASVVKKPVAEKSISSPILMPSHRPLVWIDCEMTGLDPDTDTIMSIACYVTDAQLNLLDKDGWETRVHHTQEQLDRMNEWCIKTHGASGLTGECLASTTTHEQAAEGLLAYIKKYVPAPRNALLAGNSVHADRGFLRVAPYHVVTDFLHYRIMDVSTIKEAADRWSPSAIRKNIPRKKGLHTAREDILESIEEAQYYREKIFGAEATA